MGLLDMRSPRELAGEFEADYADLKDAPWCWSPSQLNNVARCPRLGWFRARTRIEEPTTEKRAAQRQLGKDVHLVAACFVLQDLRPPGLRGSRAENLVIAASGEGLVPGSFSPSLLRAEWQPEVRLMEEHGIPGNLIIDVTDYRHAQRGSVPKVIDWKISRDSKFDLSEEQLGYDLQMLSYAEAAARTAEAQDVRVTAVELEHVHLYTEGMGPRRVAVTLTRDQVAQRYAARIPDLVRESREAYTRDHPRAVRADKTGCSRYGGCPYRARCAALDATQRTHPQERTDMDQKNPLNDEQLTALTTLLASDSAPKALSAAQVRWAVGQAVGVEVLPEQDELAAAAMRQAGMSLTDAGLWAKAVEQPAAAPTGWGVQTGAYDAAELASQTTQPTGELSDPAAVNPPDATKLGQPDPSVPAAAHLRYVLDGDAAVYEYEIDNAPREKPWRKPGKFTDKLMGLGWTVGEIKQMDAQRVYRAIHGKRRPERAHQDTPASGSLVGPAAPIKSVTVVEQTAPGAVTHRAATEPEPERAAVEAVNAGAGDVQVADERLSAAMASGGVGKVEMNLTEAIQTTEGALWVTLLRVKNAGNFDEIERCAPVLRDLTQALYWLRK